MLSLYVLQGPDHGMRYTLPDNQPQLIGRSSLALPLTDRSVSRRHAELTPDGRDWYIRDLDSANGTYINGERINERARLSPGDQIRCGSTIFVFAVQPDEKKPGPVRVLGPEIMDATVEKTVSSEPGDGPSSEDSLILASPDPAAAAVRHLRIIYEITRITSETIERDDLLNRIMDLIFDEFQPDRGFILLQDDAEVRPVAASQSRIDSDWGPLDPIVIRYKETPKSLDEGHIPVSRTIVQHTMRKREGVLSSNAMQDTRFRSGDSVMRYGIRSAICVPIRSGDRVFGVIHIDSSVANFTFTDEQLRLMSAVGLHTGLALKTSELVGTRVQTERLAAIGETVASLSHSIRNILQGLRGGADAVELAINRNDLKLAREAWPIVARNLDRIFALTMNMLAFSKTRDPEFEMENPHVTIAEAADLIRPQCEQKRVALVQDLDEAMPPIPIDSNAVHQALMNLLVNALDAVKEKKGVISIRTQFDPGRHLACIHVSDNGEGIDPAHRDRIFEPFVSTKGQRGTGLGLAVARKIAREHGGDVVLAASVDDDGERRRMGAEFILTLPVKDVKFDASATSLPRRSPDGWQ